jgi:hypothetical protein
VAKTTTTSMSASSAHSDWSFPDVRFLLALALVALAGRLAEALPPGDRFTWWLVAGPFVGVAAAVVTAIRRARGRGPADRR